MRRSAPGHFGGTQTNSEALAGAEVKLRHRNHHDLTKGVAITSSFHPDECTPIEPVRYGTGSNAMALLATVMTDGGRTGPALGQMARSGRPPPRPVRLAFGGHRALV